MQRGDLENKLQSRTIRELFVKILRRCGDGATSLWEDTLNNTISEVISEERPEAKNTYLRAEGIIGYERESLSTQSHPKMPRQLCKKPAGLDSVTHGSFKHGIPSNYNSGQRRYCKLRSGV